MRRIALLASAAALFGLAPLSARLGVVPGALTFLALAVLFACAASGGMSALAAAAGAAGAFASAVVSPVSAATGGAILVALAYAERTTRVRGRNAQVVHVGVALVAGALAGTLAGAYEGGALTLRVVSIVVASVLASLPLLVDADDLVAHALDAIAVSVDEPARAALREGAELRRNADAALLDRATSRIARRTWSSLVRLAEARLRLQRARAVRLARPHAPGGTLLEGAARAASPADAVVTMVDARIAEHVSALARAYTAVDAARAAEIGLDDAALRNVESVGESLEEVSRAFIDVQP
jgi:hypothetical protein